jgi:hypothetical protein
VSPRHQAARKSRAAQFIERLASSIADNLRYDRLLNGATMRCHR